MAKKKPTKPAKKRRTVGVTLAQHTLREAEAAIARGEFRSIGEWLESAISERDALWIKKDITERVVSAYEQAIFVWGQLSRQKKQKGRREKLERRIRDCGCDDVKKLAVALRDNDEGGDNPVPIRNCAACIDHCVGQLQANLTEVQLSEEDGGVPGELALLIFQVFAECLQICAYHCRRDTGSGGLV